MVVVSERTSWVTQIVRVDDGVIHWIGGVDVDPAVAVWVLKSSGDTDIAVAIAVHEQELDLTDRAVEDL